MMQSGGFGFLSIIDTLLNLFGALKIWGKFSGTGLTLSKNEIKHIIKSLEKIAIILK